MDRIGPAGGSPTQTLTNGQQGFVDENLSTGQEGTNVPAEWMNALQEELMYLLSKAGITPNILTWTQIYASIVSLIGSQLNGYFNPTTGAFYFMVPVPGGSPFIVQGLPCSVPAGTVTVNLLLPTTFTVAFGGAVCTDNYTQAYGYGANGGSDLAHIDINCPLQQIIGGSIGTRGTANGFFICWGR